MNTTPEIVIQKLLVTRQTFTARHTQPKKGKGFVNFTFKDNRKDCLSEPATSVCWQASLIMKAFSGTNDRPDPEQDLLLMDAVVSVEGEFSVGSPHSAKDLQSMAWYFDDTCKRKLLGKMRLLLLDTEFAQIPLPGNV